MTRTLHSGRELAAGWRRALLAVLAALGLIWANTAFGEAPKAGTYRVTDGKVDQGTFSGWVVFHTACFICHGRDAVGTNIAPSLVSSLKSMSRQDFANKVLTRYRIAFGSQEASTEDDVSVKELILSEVRKSERGPKGMVAMPGWQGNSGIQAHLLDLYAYLKARADGALGPGQPAVESTKVESTTVKPK